MNSMDPMIQFLYRFVLKPCTIWDKDENGMAIPVGYKVRQLKEAISKQNGFIWPAPIG